MNGIEEITGWISCATVGSAMAPRIRDVTVIPNCAPESRRRAAQRGDDAPRCPITIRCDLRSVAAVHSHESELGVRRTR